MPRKAFVLVLFLFLTAIGVSLAGPAARADEFRVGAVRRVLDYGVQLTSSEGFDLGILNCRGVAPLQAGGPRMGVLLLNVAGRQLDFPMTQSRCRELRDWMLTEAARAPADQQIRITVDIASGRRFQSMDLARSLPGSRGLRLQPAIIGITGGQPVFEEGDVNPHQVPTGPGADPKNPGAAVPGG